jgi:hypothetical protein
MHTTNAHHQSPTLRAKTSGARRGSRGPFERDLGRQSSRNPSRRHRSTVSERAPSGSSAHYHSERNHQGIGNVIPFPAPDTPDESGPIRRRERLGGLLNFYERNAA